MTQTLTRDEIRLHILELALQHGISTDKVGVAQDFSEFVFDREPARLRVDGTAFARLGQRCPGAGPKLYFGSAKKPKAKRSKA